MDRARLGALALLSLVGAGCAEPPIYRMVMLTLGERLPRAEAVLTADQLRLVVKDLEPLKAGALFAWGKSAAPCGADAGVCSAWSPLGALGSGEVSTFTVASPTLLEEVLVTHERAAAPAAPDLLAIIFRGRPGEALSLSGYGGPTRATLLPAMVMAEFSSKQATVTTTLMPYFGGGLHYAVWMRKAGTPLLLLGRLGTTGKDVFQAADHLAVYTEVVLTIELDEGVDSFGTELMKAPTLGAGAAAPSAHAGHEH